jgi:hypothetical protein
MTAREVYALAERNRRQSGRPDLPVGLGLSFITGAVCALLLAGVL